MNVSTMYNKRDRLISMKAARALHELEYYLGQLRKVQSLCDHHFVTADGDVLQDSKMVRLMCTACSSLEVMRDSEFAKKYLIIRDAENTVVCYEKRS